MGVNDVIAVARREVGYVAPKNDGSKFGKWYAKYTGYDWYGAAGVAYCAMFVSWVYAQCPNDSIPGGYFAYVPYGINNAGDAVINKCDIEPGDLICFDWNDDGVADHVGIAATRFVGNTISTIEGNTSPGNAGSQGNGGGVYERLRYADDVICGIRTSHIQPKPINEFERMISQMKATHVLFEANGHTCVGNILAGTWKEYKDGKEYSDAVTVLKRSGAIVKSWKELGAKSNHVENTDAFGVKIN